VFAQQPALGQAHTVPRATGHGPALGVALRGGGGGEGRGGVRTPGQGSGGGLQWQGLELKHIKICDFPL